MLPPAQRSCGVGRMSIHAGLSTIRMLQMHPTGPLERHLVSTRTAFAMSTLTASIVSNKLVAPFEGQMESQSAHPGGMSSPLRDVRASRPHLSEHSSGSAHVRAPCALSWTEPGTVRTRGNSRLRAEMLLARKSGPMRSICAPQNARLVASLSGQNASPTMAAAPARDWQLVCWYW